MSALTYLAAVLVLGIFAQWLAWRLRLSAILLLLAFGFCAGPFVRPDQYLNDQILFPLVSLAVAVIMFEGGLSLRLADLKESGGVVVRLVTLAVLLTWGMAAFGAWWLLGFRGEVAAVLGAILVVSGPTVMIPLLRHMRPTRPIGSIAKWEGIVNDPIGAVLAVLVFEVVLEGVHEGAGAWIGSGMLMTALTGTVLGGLAAGLVVGLFRRYWIPDYLQSSSVLAIVITSFVLSDWVQPESGLLTTTVMGVLLANQKRVRVQHVIEFKENLRVLLISSLFIVLASRVHWDDLKNVGWQGLVFLLGLLLVVRPIAVFLATWGTQLSLREKVLLSWLAPRGIVAAAVSSLFALEIQHAAQHAAVDPVLEKQFAQLIPVVFLVIMGTVTVYGLTAVPLARWLGLSAQNPQGVLFAGASDWVARVAQVLQDEGFEVLLVDTNYRHVAAARQAGLPTCYASVLSEYIHEEQDFAGLGRLLAVTPNDSVNSLATIEFSEEFGQAGVFQLATPDPGSERRVPSGDLRRGRTLFTETATYGALASRFAAGDELRVTKLTDDFSYQDYRQQYGDAALVMFTIDAQGRLNITATDAPLEPKAGDRLISLVSANG